MVMTTSELKDAIAKAIADARGHGMREKCQADADAALKVVAPMMAAATQAEQPEDSRCPPTFRREAAVETLIGLGWKWDGQKWAAEQGGRVDRFDLWFGRNYPATNDGANSGGPEESAIRDCARQAYAAALAQNAQGEAVDYVPGEIDRTAPARIWLQIDTSGDNAERYEPWPGDDGVSWCSEPIGGLEIQYVRADLHTAPARAPQFQAGVAEWMGQCFLPSLYSNMTERGDRLMEEVLELLQSKGYDPSRVATLVDYVWGRPVGEPAQEVGGVMVTLAGFCWIAGLNMHEAGDTELARINQPEVMEKIRRKQQAKNALHFDTPVPGQATDNSTRARTIVHWPRTTGRTTAQLAALQGALQLYPSRNTHQLQAAKVCAGVARLADELLAERAEEVARG